MPRVWEHHDWWACEPPLAGAADALPSGDDLFRQLDGRFVRVGTAGWRIEIYSVWAEELRWVQLALRGPSDHMLVMRLPLEAGPFEFLTEIEQWLRSPATVDSVCSVAPCDSSVAGSPGIH